MQKSFEEHINEAFKDKILNRSVNGIYVYDLIRGTNIYINQQYTHLTGYTLDGINSMTNEEFFALFHPDDQAAIAEHMEEVLRSEPEEVIEIEYRFQKSNGEWMWCYSKDAIFFRDDEGSPTQFMGSFVDITRRKQQEAIIQENQHKLELKNQELEQFTYLASHDLQGPLKTITNYINLIQEDYAEQLDEHAAKYLQVISNAAGRMKLLINGLLDYSRLGEKREVESVNCKEIVENILSDLALLISEAHASFDIDPLPTIKGNKTELILLFQNLIINAIKFRKKGIAPHISIRVKKGKQYWEFAIQDNGIGIEEEYRERIFIIFQRLHNRKEYKGTGIGLAHCLKIVKAHRGRIWVESQPDEGSTFFFTIPI